MTPRRLAILASFLPLALTAPVFAAPSFSDCFPLKADVSYQMGDSVVSTAKIDINGKPAIQMDTVNGNIRNTLIYDMSGRKLLRSVNWSMSDRNTPDVTVDWTTAPTHPEQVAPGQSFKLSGKGTQITASTGERTEIDFDGYSHYTFVGFEDLPLDIDGKERVFKNVCHLRVKEEGKTIETWHAAGFGQIKFKYYEGEMLMLAEEMSEIFEE
ncbi:hypothetical protein [Enterobacter sp.]|uniref:hypothetical protein n=1 Tax=Enterobacter sp. TaxID=42895 RepID=UPI00296F0B46|nr:hypothetical protein [Enterobacter sp.]